MMVIRKNFLDYGFRKYFFLLEFKLYLENISCFSGLYLSNKRVNKNEIKI